MRIPFLDDTEAADIVEMIVAGHSARLRVSEDFLHGVRADLRSDDVDACVERLGRSSERLRVSCFGSYEGEPFQETIGLAGVPDAIRSGYACVVEDIRPLSPTVARASEQLHDAIGFAPTPGAVAFSLSPPGESVPQHYDGCEVLCVQVDGVKTFDVGRVVEVPFPSRPLFSASRTSGQRDGHQPAQRFVPEDLPSADTLRSERFASGDAWWMSRGWWHRTSTPAAGGYSAGLIFKVQAVTGVTRATNLIHRLLEEDPDLRRPIAGLWSQDPRLRDDAEQALDEALTRAFERLTLERASR